MLSINNVIVERIFAWNKVIYGTSPNRSRWRAVGLDEMAGRGEKGGVCHDAGCGALNGKQLDFIRLFASATYLIWVPIA